jgi:broad specificity phosphatase PhoE
MSLRLSFVAVLLAALWSNAALAQRAVIVLRHAEKASDTEKDPELSLFGEDRAIALTRFLRGNRVDAIFVTDLKRTQATAAPLARQRGLKPAVLPAGDTAALVAKLRALPPEQVPVVIGHSNTIPAILTGLGVKQKVELRDDEYNRLFVVHGDGTAAGLLEFHFGGG